MRRHSHPLIYSESGVVLLDAANSGDCRLRPADFRILLPILMACLDEAPTHGGKMAGDADFAGAAKAAPVDHPLLAGQRLKLQTDAVLDALIFKLEPKADR